MLVFLSEVFYFINEQVQLRGWHLRHYKCPQILLACLKLNLDSLFLGIDKVEPLWPVLVYSLTLSVKPSIVMVLFQNQLGLEKKHIASLMYYLTQFWLISFCTWPRAINIAETPQNLQLKQRLCVEDGEGKANANSTVLGLALFFSWLSFWPFLWPNAPFSHLTANFGENGLVTRGSSKWFLSWCTTIFPEHFENSIVLSYVTDFETFLK